MRSQRPGQKVFKNPGASFGVKVVEPGFPSAAGGWWDDFGNVPPGCCVAAYQAKGAASLAASYIDLSGSGNNCGPGVAPAWNAGVGWTFNGINQYLVTPIIPGPPYTYSAIIQFANAGGGAIFGTFGGANSRFYIAPSGVSYRWGNNIPTVAPALAAGNLAETPLAGYRNGAPEAAWAGWPGGPAPASFIGCLNSVGIPGSYCPCDIIAHAIYSCNIDAWVAAIAAWMAAI